MSSQKAPKKGPAYVPKTIQKQCVYCLSNKVLNDNQILLHGQHLYLCAPRGQLVEGYLVISPFSCIGSLSALPADWFPELYLIIKVVSVFYQETYGVTNMTLYEQGRGGGGARIDAAGRFPFHAHLCCLPLIVDLHSFLSQHYTRKPIARLEDLSIIAPGCPYVYIESQDKTGVHKSCVYVPATEIKSVELERIRLKPIIASLIDLPMRGNWRTYPGDNELKHLIKCFDLFKRRFQ